jgi:hypothetical protein
MAVLRNLALIFAGLLMSLLIVSVGVCGTYYVDKGGIDSDGRGGSDNPWQTVAYALTKVGHGDTLSINDGVYSEYQLVIPVGVSLTSTSQSHEKVCLQPILSLGSSEPFVKLSSPIPGSDGDQFISHIEFNGINGSARSSAAFIVQNRNNVRIHHCNIHDFTGDPNGYGVNVLSTQISRTNRWWDFMPEDLQEPGIDDNLNALWPANPVENFELDNNIIRDCGYRESLSGGSYLQAVQLFNLKDSRIHDNTINLMGSRNQAIGGCSAILWNVDIYRNKLSMVRYIDRGSFVIEMWVMRNGCEIYENQANAFFSITIGKETKVYRNTITAATDSANVYQGDIGIEFMFQSYGEVSNNIIKGTNYAGIDAGLGKEHQAKNYYLRNTKISGNKISNIKGYGISVFCGGGHYVNNINTVTGFEISYNTIDTSTWNWALIHVGEYNDGTGVGVLKDFTIKSNVLKNGAGYAGWSVGELENVNIIDNTFQSNGINDWKDGNDINTYIASDDEIIPDAVASNMQIISAPTLRIVVR